MSSHTLLRFFSPARTHFSTRYPAATHFSSATYPLELTFFIRSRYQSPVQTHSTIRFVYSGHKKPALRRVSDIFLLIQCRVPVVNMYNRFPPGLHNLVLQVANTIQFAKRISDFTILVSDPTIHHQSLTKPRH